MNLEPLSDSDDSEIKWRCDVHENRLTFQVQVRCAVSLEFAQHALQDAIERKNKAVTGRGDGLSLDLLLGSLPKEAINDFGRTIESNSTGVAFERLC